MKFIVTNELGKLARWLRIAGFDTIYQKEDNFSAFIINSLREGRMILTRRHTRIDNLEKHILVIDSNDFKSQLKEVFKN